MAKQLSDLIADARQHLGQPDATNSNFTDSQLTIWINEAYREACIEIRHLPALPVDYAVTGQTVTLNSGTLTADNVLLQDPNQVAADGNPKYQKLTNIDIDQLCELDPSWADAPADKPKYFARNGLYSGILYPPPPANVIALTTPLRVIGLTAPTDLSSPTDTPNLPVQVHDILGHWVAYRGFSQLENQAKATEHLQLFQTRLKSSKGVSTQFSRRLKGWRWEDAI